MANREREERRERYASAERRAELNETGDRTAVTVPQGMKLFTVKKKGVYRLDILPYVVGRGNKWAEPGDKFYERTYYAHRGVGPNNETHVCANKTFGKRCPICEHAAKLRQDPNRRDDAKEFFPKQRQLFLVRDRDDQDAGVQLWDISFHLFGKLLDFRINTGNKDLEYGKFFRNDPGMYLEIGMEEKSYSGNKFYEAKSIDFIPRKKPLSSSLLSDLPCLDELPIAPDYAKLKKIFLQTQAGDDADDPDDAADDDAPRGRGRSRDDDTDDDEPRGRTRGRSDDSDDVDDDPPPRRGRSRDTDDEDDEPRRPLRGRGSDPSSDEPDDDDVPFDDDKPRGGGRGRTRDSDDDAPRRPLRGRGRFDDPDDVDDEPEPTRRRGALNADDDE